MARYGIAQGGNKRNFPEWDNLYSSARDGFIHYASHLMTRHKVIPLNFDGGHPNWQSYFKQEVAGGKLVQDDELDMVWLNAGSFVNRVVVQNKRIPGGTTTIEVRVQAEDGTVLVAPVAVPLTALGWQVIPVNAMLSKNASVVMKVTGADPEMDEVCLTVFAELVNFNSEHECSCLSSPCDVLLPNPVCFTPTL